MGPGALDMMASECHHDGMIRAQIQLTEEQHRRLHELAAARRLSVAELVRQGVDLLLRETERHRKWENLFSALGELRDPDDATDVSERHDEYLERALGADPGLR